MIVVADTSPLNYLILIGEIDLIPRLYGRVIIPQAVYDELRATKAPDWVQHSTETLPPWVEVRQPTLSPDPSWGGLGPGERQAITLAEEVQAAAILIDDRDGRRHAARRNLPVIGTLTVLSTAAESRFISLTDAFARLRHAGFHASPELYQFFLDRHPKRVREGN